MDGFRCWWNKEDAVQSFGNEENDHRDGLEGEE
jgi:hypothetical protein